MMLISTQKVTFDRWDHSECQERELWARGYYHVRKYADMDSDRKKTDGLTFIAVFNKEDDPKENANVDIALVNVGIYIDRGEIVNIDFLKNEYLHCGIEETLVNMVLQDSDVSGNGGVLARIIMINSFFINVKYLKETRSECKSMIHLYNKWGKEAYDYLTAAQEAEFGVLYVADEPNHMCAVSIGRALREYRQEWTTFNSNWPIGYGRFWYFCICKNRRCTFYDYGANLNEKLPANQGIQGNTGHVKCIN